MADTTPIDAYIPAPAPAVPPTSTRFAYLVAGSFVAAFFGSLILLRVFLSIYRLLGRIVWGDAPIANVSSGGLSAEKKKEIDDLRSALIHRHLSKFTVTLNEIENDAPVQPAIIQHSAKCCLATKGMLTDDEGEEHKLIIDINKETANDNKAKETVSEQQYTRLPNTCIEIPQKCLDVLKCVDDSDNKLDCAICQEEYKPSERICWSSNSECTHVFHEECMVRWLVSLGWVKLKEQKMHESMFKDEEKLLDYDLECPFCRRDFIDKSLFAAEGGEDNV